MSQLFREHLNSGRHQRTEVNVATPEAKFKRRHRMSDKCGVNFPEKAIFPESSLRI